MRQLTSVLPIALLSSCASIVSSSDYPVMVDTVPSGENVTVANKAGLVVYDGRTPMTLMLEASSGFWQNEVYSVTTESGRTARLAAKVDPWLFGNILFGGFIGALIVDPATGAMWKLDARVAVPLGPQEEEAPEETPAPKSFGKPSA